MFKQTHKGDEQMYRIEITADSAAELKNKIAELAGEFTENVTVEAKTVNKFEEFVNDVETPTLMKQVGADKLTEKVEAEPSGDLDADGLPHDERIHASTKTKVGGNKWKRKRNVSDEEFAKVAAELRNKIAQIQIEIPAPPIVQPVVAAPVVEFTPDLSAPPVNFGAPVRVPEATAEVPHIPQPVVAPVIPQMPPVPQPVPQNNVVPVSFTTFLSSFAVLMQDLINTGKVNMEWVSAKTAKYGVSYVYEITSNLEKSKGFYADLVSEGLIGQG